MGGLALEPQSGYARDDLTTPIPNPKPRVERAVAKFFPEMKIAGFTRFDGAMMFHTFINALLRPEMIVLDFGAGRGSVVERDQAPHRTSHCAIRGKVAKLIGVDIDPIVRQNPSLDEALVIVPGGTIPLADCSIDLIFSWSTFEHITDPDPVQREMHRILKPGGWVCANTPNKNGYIAIGARIVPNKLHKALLRWMQPQRPSIDVFPTAYRLNTRSDIRRCFRSDHWEVIMFPWNTEPGYMDDNHLAVRLLSVAGKHLPDYFQLHWSIFMRKIN